MLWLRFWLNLTYDVLWKTNNKSHHIKGIIKVAVLIISRISPKFPKFDWKLDSLNHDEGT